jgi:hypothetical protein
VTALTGLAVLGAAGATTIDLVRADSPKTRFASAAFRSAAVREDHGELRAQAQAAVDEHALVGMTAQQLRRVLGEPTRVYRNTSRVAWQIDDWTTSGAPGAKLVVTVDRRSRRVTAAQLQPPQD